MFLYIKRHADQDSCSVQPECCVNVLKSENVSLLGLAQTSLHSYLKIDAADSQYRGGLWIQSVQSLFHSFPLLLLRHLQLMLKVSLL